MNIQNNKILAFIPARGGSVEVPNKNIQPINGKPLIAYTIEAAIESNVTDHIYVSTNSEEIGEKAKKSGAEVIWRPEEISGFTASVEAGLIHTLDFLEEEKGLSFDYALNLHVTSPLRSAMTIRKFVDHYMTISDKYDAMLTLTETRSDFWINDGSDSFKRLFPDAPRRRQERNPLFYENSAIYITKVSALRETNSMLTNNCAGYVIDEHEAVDINTMLDLEWAGYLMNKRVERDSD